MEDFVLILINSTERKFSRRQPCKEGKYLVILSSNPTVYYLADRFIDVNGEFSWCVNFQGKDYFLSDDEICEWL